MTVHRSIFSLELEIEGLGRFPVSQFGSDWAINTIPTASCVLPLGRAMASGTVSPAHKGIWAITDKPPAKVYFRASGQFAENQAWPEDEIVIFDGRLTGRAQHSSSGSRGLSVQLTHWLSYLDSASALSAAAHPANPLQYSFSAVVGNDAMASGFAAARGMAQYAMTEHIADSVAVSQDLWGNCLKPLLANVLETDSVKFSGVLANCIPNIHKKVDITKYRESLARINGVVTLPKLAAYSTPLPAYGTTLGMNGAGALPLEIVRAMTYAIGDEGVNSYAANTIWSKIISYAASFLFAVVPLTSRALVVPFSSLTRQAYKVVEANETEMQQLAARSNRNLRATAIWSSLGDKTGWSQPPLSQTGIGGCYSPPNADPNGQIWTLNAPSWLNNLRVNGFTAGTTTGLKNNTAAGGATTPAANNPALAPAVTPAQRVAETGELFNGYAHAAYVNEALRGRVGSISQKLRFDIAPGSIVQVKSEGDRFIKDDDTTESLYGAVTSVSIGINADAPAAGTRLQLENFRTDAENNDERTSVAQHPLYTTLYKGAPLVDELQF